MNTLEIKGIEYKKSAAAARELGYTADYVGQLCRSGKIDAKLVGRSWYVNLHSIQNHKENRYRSVAKKSQQAVREALKHPPVTTGLMTRTQSSSSYELDPNDLLPSLKEKTSDDKDESVEPVKTPVFKPNNETSFNKVAISHISHPAEERKIDSVSAIQKQIDSQENSTPSHPTSEGQRDTSESVRMHRPGTLAVRRLRKLEEESAPDSPTSTRPARPILAGVLLGLTAGCMLFVSGQAVTATTVATPESTQTDYEFDRSAVLEIGQSLKNTLKNMGILFGSS